MLSPGHFLRGQGGLVRVDVNCVRINAHTQFGAAGREREEARLQPHWKEYEWPRGAGGELRSYGGRVRNVRDVRISSLHNSQLADHLSRMNSDTHRTLQRDESLMR